MLRRSKRTFFAHSRRRRGVLIEAIKRRAGCRASFDARRSARQTHFEADPLRDNDAGPGARKILGAIRDIKPHAIQRLTRSAGIRRKSEAVYENIFNVFWNFVDSIVYSSKSFAFKHRRKTTTNFDVLCAFKRTGGSVYGFGSYAHEVAAF